MLPEFETMTIETKMFHRNSVFELMCVVVVVDNVNVTV